MNNFRPSRQGLLHRYFAFLERRGLSDRLLIHATLIAILGSLLLLVIQINNVLVTSVPTAGGTLVEGVVGTPRFVNPVLAITRADHDMAALVYSGLVKLDHTGTIVPDIAEQIRVSEDGRTYHINLRQDVFFHDGTPLTVKDVAYTIALIQNPDLKSPLQGNWDGVLVEELGDYEMNIVLKEAYTPFIENLRVGILPRNLWDQLPTEQMPFSQNNTEPIGSGPYKIVDVFRNKSGLINGYRLEAFPNYDARPNITSLFFKFYQNEAELITALKNKEIGSTASLTTTAFTGLEADDYEVITQTLPRTFTVYFNQNKASLLRDRAVREALSVVIDRDALVATVLEGAGRATDTPVPPDFLELPVATSSNTDRLTVARTLLTEAGWSQNETGQWTKAVGDEGSETLRITLTTANTPLFDATAQFVATAWQELGVEVSVSQYEQADLVQAIIRPRNFEALLFGAEIGRAIDLYPFWHSSQKDDPGLNIAQYTNIETDALLSDIRVATNTASRNEKIAEVVSIIDEDQPAVFLFSPTFSYLIDPDVHVTPLSRIGSQSDRFANISTWHIKSDKVWPIFSN